MHPHSSVPEYYLEPATGVGTPNQEDSCKILASPREQNTEKQFLQDVTGCGLPTLTKVTKEDLQQIFSVLQRPLLEVIVAGRYNLEYEYKVAAVKRSQGVNSLRLSP